MRKLSSEKISTFLGRKLEDVVIGLLWPPNGSQRQVHLLLNRRDRYLRFFFGTNHDVICSNSHTRPFISNPALSWHITSFSHVSRFHDLGICQSYYVVPEQNWEYLFINYTLRLNLKNRVGLCSRQYVQESLFSRVIFSRYIAHLNTIPWRYYI